MGENLLGVYWGYNSLILTFDPNFQRDIQVGVAFGWFGQGSHTILDISGYLQTVPIQFLLTDSSICEVRTYSGLGSRFILLMVQKSG